MNLNITELVRAIQETDYWNGAQVSWSITDELDHLPSQDYEQVVRSLLTEPVPDHEHLRGIEYRNAYKHRIYGCILFVLRPTLRLYRDVLIGALDIGDPSSMKYGAIALRQAKPIEQIGLDLLQVLEQQAGNKNILESVLGLFYWLGFSSSGKVQPYGGGIVIDKNLAILMAERTPPESEPTKLVEVASKVAQVIRAAQKDRQCCQPVLRHSARQ